MRTPQDVADGGRLSLDPLTTLALQGRDALPHALNGRPIPPSDPRAANIRREMQQGRSREFPRIRTVMRCDLKDGVPFALVVAPLRDLIAELELEAVALHQVRRLERPVTALIARETKVQARLDLAELKVAESPTCAAALEDAIREAGMQESATVALREGMERQLAVVRAQSVPVYGARRARPHLEVAK